MQDIRGNVVAVDRHVAVAVITKQRAELRSGLVEEVDERGQKVKVFLPSSNRTVTRSPYDVAVIA